MESARTTRASTTHPQPLRHPSGVSGGSPARQPARRPGQHCLTWQEPPGALVGGGQHDGLAGLTWHVMAPEASHISILSPATAACCDNQPQALGVNPEPRALPPAPPPPLSPHVPRNPLPTDPAAPGISLCTAQNGRLRSGRAASPHRRFSCPPAGPFVGPLEGEWAARGQLGFETPRPLDSRCRHGFEGHGLLSVVPPQQERFKPGLRAGQGEREGGRMTERACRAAGESGSAAVSHRGPLLFHYLMMP